MINLYLIIGLHKGRNVILAEYLNDWYTYVEDDGDEREINYFISQIPTK